MVTWRMTKIKMTSIKLTGVIARAKRRLTIRKQPSFVPGPRIFYCYALLFLLVNRSASIICIM